MSPKAAAAAKKLPNPADQNHIQKALDDLANELLPKFESVVEDVAKDPKEGPKREELQAIGEKIKDELDAIREALKGDLAAPPLPHNYLGN